MPIRTLAARLFPLVLAPGAWSQAFQFAPDQVPQGWPFNRSHSENIDFADIDLDGDFDCLVANGGEEAADQNRLWVNLGGLQGGTLGFFGDVTATQCPAIIDSSRDVELADLDGDLDPDMAVANTSFIWRQGVRLWRNQGGFQGGQPGYFSEVTSTSFQGLGVTGSTVAPSLVLPDGNYISYAGDVEFGDLDADGDLDLVVAEHSPNFGKQRSPTRMFLNSGTGTFSEFNPTGATGNTPGLLGIWSEGRQADGTPIATGLACDVTVFSHDVDFADVDGDLDLDFVLGSAAYVFPRIFHNRLSESGAAIFRDVTGTAFPPLYATSDATYEQELGDLDNDGDVDIWGSNWRHGDVQWFDITLRNIGVGVFDNLTFIWDSAARDHATDLLDFDNDGDLDQLSVGFHPSTFDHRLFRNLWSGVNFSFIDVTSTQLPIGSASPYDADVSDFDGDGDYDVMVANGYNQANYVLKNVHLASDVHAPRLVHLEQAPNRVAGVAPTRIRVLNHGNAPYYVTWYDTLALEFNVNSGAILSVPMRSSGGNVFYGEIPGNLVGQIGYRVVGADRYGNSAVAPHKTFVASADPCAGALATYCIAKVNSLGCTPGISTSGFPSASAGSGFEIRTYNLLLNASSMMIYSVSGPDSTSFMGGTWCLALPFVRMDLKSTGGGSPCGGVLRVDFNEWIATGGDPALVPGQSFWIQTWSRDPNDSFGINLSNGLTGTICP